MNPVRSSTDEEIKQSNPSEFTSLFFDSKKRGLLKTSNGVKPEFPKGFYWGSATSSHQVEGNNHNDWSEWEIRNAKLKVQSAKLSPPAGGWPDFILKNYPNPLQEENYISGRACDHYNRFREDFDIAKSLGHNAHRFSIEWSRIEPEEGKFDEKEIEHYRQVILALRERGIEPFVTLWHWTNPIWFAQKGGWLNPDAPKYFERYVNKITLSLKDVNVNFWITLNETNIYTGLSYLKGIWPPEKSSIVQYLKVNRHLSRAHIAAYKIIKSKNAESQIGVAYNLMYFTKFPAKAKNHIFNHLFLNSVKNYQDFIGVNYYHSDRETGENSEFLHWSIDPEGFYHVLKDIKKYNKPIYITENGIADARDEKRAQFIKEHLKWVHKAIQEGVDVCGYFHWSLLDNFEWDKGFWPRFGLVEVDYKTMERKIRSSALEYKKIIQEGLS